MRAKRKRVKPVAGPPYEPCASCGNGWVLYQDGKEIRAKRCWCWLDHQAKYAEKGAK